MELLVPAFQVEIRYNHILNFSQIAREILSPYVKLSQSIKIENQNTLHEKVILNFEEENYTITANWDRLIFRGQGSLEKYYANNSAIEMPFFSILEKFKELSVFGSVQNILIAVNFLTKIESNKEELLKLFKERYLTDASNKILTQDYNDIAITLEKREENNELSISFGPYFGFNDLLTRHVLPVNLESIKQEMDFMGILIEYKCFEKCNDIDFSKFKSLMNSATKTANKIWKH
ncbi:MAG: hypothetical protein AB7O47_13200 [Flavobacteriales bacterium]